MHNRSTLNILSLIFISGILPVVGIAISFYLDWPPSPLAYGFAALLVFLGILSALVLESVESLRTIQYQLSRPHEVDVYTDEQFYPQLARDFSAATSTVDISYMHTSPPDANPKKAKKDYYGNFMKSAQQSTATIRRIDRATLQNIEWITRISEGFSGNPNLSYAVWTGGERRLAVQTIDGEITFMVAVGQEEVYGIPRDGRVKSVGFTKLWRGYYDNMWGDPKCIRLVTSGTVDAAALSKLEALLRGKP
jgi:hypothetical protein